MAPRKTVEKHTEGYCTKSYKHMRKQHVLQYNFLASWLKIGEPHVISAMCKEHNVNTV